MAYVTRIINQHAVMLFPDTIPIESFLNHYTVKDPRILEEMQGGMFVEDLSKAYRCEVFRLAPSPLAIETLRNIKDAIYPFDDFTHYMLEGWMKTFYESPSGNLPMPIPVDDLGILQCKIMTNTNKLQEVFYEGHEEKFNQ